MAETPSSTRSTLLVLSIRSPFLVEDNGILTHSKGMHEREFSLVRTGALTALIAVEGQRSQSETNLTLLRRRANLQVTGTDGNFAPKLSN